MAVVLRMHTIVSASQDSALLFTKAHLVNLLEQVIELSPACEQASQIEQIARAGDASGAEEVGVWLKRRR